MPRLTKRDPKYACHKSSGQARTRHNNKTYYWGEYGSPESRAKYNAFCASLWAGSDKPEVKARLPEPAPGERLKVWEIVERFFQHADTYYQRDGVPTGEHLVVRWSLQPLYREYGNYPADQFGPKLLKELQAKLVTDGASRSRVNRVTRMVCRCYRWAASEELVSANVAMALRTVPALRAGRTAARECPPILPVSDQDVEATLPHLGDLVATMVRVQRLTGMRPGELLRMTAGAIDRNGDTWTYTPRAHKTLHHGRSRTVFIGPRAQEILLPLLLKAGSGPIFSEHTVTSYRRAVDRGCRRARVKVWSPNKLRHSLATEVRAKFGLEAAQVMLGHANANVTQVYAERDADKGKAIARRIG
jgi:integrase